MVEPVDVFHRDNPDRVHRLSSQVRRPYESAPRLRCQTTSLDAHARRPRQRLGRTRSVAAFRALNTGPHCRWRASAGASSKSGSSVGSASNDTACVAAVDDALAEGKVLVGRRPGGGRGGTGSSRTTGAFAMGDGSAVAGHASAALRRTRAVTMPTWRGVRAGSPARADVTAMAMSDLVQVAWLKAAALDGVFNRCNFLQARQRVCSFVEFSTLAHRILA